MEQLNCFGKIQTSGNQYIKKNFRNSTYIAEWKHFLNCV